MDRPNIRRKNPRRAGRCRRALMLGAIAASLAGPALAASGAVTFGQTCTVHAGRLLSVGSTTDPRGNVSATSILLCAVDGIRKISTFFVATSRNGSAYATETVAPWFTVDLKDQNGKVLLSAAGAVLALTQDCRHGYEHATVLAFPRLISTKTVVSFDARLGSSRAGSPCGQGTGGMISAADITTIVSVPGAVLTR